MTEEITNVEDTQTIEQSTDATVGEELKVDERMYSEAEIRQMFPGYFNKQPKAQQKAVGYKLKRKKKQQEQKRSRKINRK